MSSTSIRCIGPTPTCRSRKPRQAMADLQRAGKIRLIGVSNFSPAQIDAFRAGRACCIRCSRRTICSSAVSKQPFFPIVARTNIATLAYGPLCRGLLSGRMSAQTQFAGDDLRKERPEVPGASVCAISAGG